MAARHNGARLPNGTASECIDGVVTTVGVDWSHPVDLIEPLDDPPRANESYAAGLQYLCRYDGRTLAEIAAGLGCTKQLLGRIVTQLSDRLKITTTAPGRRRPKRTSAAPLAERDASLFTLSSDVNGGGLGQ